MLSCDTYHCLKIKIYFISTVFVQNKSENEI